jgi:hypothetical protein
MDATPKLRSRLLTNLENVVAQAHAGAFTKPDGHVDDTRLRDQIMRIWRLQDIDSPHPGTKTMVLFVPPNCETLAQCVSWLEEENGRCHRPGPTGENPILSEAQEIMPARKACPQKSRHGVIKRKGETCADCGFNSGNG